MPTKKPASQAAAEEFRAELADRDETAAAEMARRWVKIEDRLQPKIIPLVKEIQQAKENGEEINRAALLQLRRFQDLGGQVLAEMTRFNNYAGGVINRLQKNAIDFAGITAADLIMATAADAGAVGITFNRLATEAAENLAALARAGNPLHNLLRLSHPLAVGGITDRLVEGVAIGVNPRVVARGIINDGLTQGFKHILLVSRDQHMRAFRMATLQGFNQSGVTRGYRRLAAKNDRTCLACLALDGTIYELRELMPVHPQDRCAMIPVLDRFPPVNYETGEQWFKKQPEAYQKKAMGPGRFKLWQKGGFTFKQLATIKDNPTWGPGAAVTPLKDLLRGQGGAGNFQLPLTGLDMPADPPKVPKFKTRKKAEEWVTENYPNITADFKGAALGAIQPTIEAFDEMARRFPEVAARLEYIGTYRTPEKRPLSVRRRKRFWKKGVYAHASFYDGKRIGLNPKFYGKPDHFIQILRSDAAAGWHPPILPGQEIQSVFIHEFGHMVDRWLQKTVSKKAFTPIVGIDGKQLVSEPFYTWRRNAAWHSATISRYATTNDKETFAEAFSSVFTSPPGEKSPYAEGLEGFLNEINQRPLYDEDDYQWFLDIRRNLSEDEKKLYREEREELINKYALWLADRDRTKEG